MNIFPFYYLMDTQSVFSEGTAVTVFIKIYIVVQLRFLSLFNAQLNLLIYSLYAHTNIIIIVEVVLIIIINLNK